MCNMYVYKLRYVSLFYLIRRFVHQSKQLNYIHCLIRAYKLAQMMRMLSM